MAKATHGGARKWLVAERPEYLPGVAMMARVLAADGLVVADDLPVAVQSPVCRGAIKSREGRQWLSVPVLRRGRGSQSIREVRIADDHDWRRRPWKALQVNYRPSPYFDYYADFFADLYGRPWTFLIDLQMAVLGFALRALGIERRVWRATELGVGEGDIGERVRGYLAATGSGGYVADAALAVRGEGNLSLDETGELMYIFFKPVAYRQLFGGFVSGLTGFDVLFNYGPESRHPLRRSLEVAGPFGER